MGMKHIDQVLGGIAIGAIGAGIFVLALDSDTGAHHREVEIVTPAQPSSTPAGAQVFDDEPGFNCLTMGNKVCGPDYLPVGEDLAAMLKGSLEGKPTTDYTTCLQSVGDTTIIVCPDGTVIES